jgi:hypothetical protein
MKKILIILLLICLITVGCGKKEEKEETETIDFHDEKIDKLRESHDKIDKVIARKFTEGGMLCYDITDYKEDAYKSVVDMKVIGKGEGYNLDNGLSYQFILNDSTSYSFEFNNGNYVKQFKDAYKLAKTNYKIYYDKQVGCEDYEEK